MNRVMFLGVTALLPLAPLGCEGELSVPELPPYADAGFDQVRYLGGAASVIIELDGRASCDPMGGALGEAAWEVAAAPAGVPEVVATGALRAQLTAEAPGEYLFSLVVTAGERQSEPDYMTVRVEPGFGEDMVVAPPSTTACGDALP